MRKSVLLLTLTVLAVLLACGVALAYPADLDPTFSEDGMVTTDFSPPDELTTDWAQDVALHSGGKIVAGGFATGSGQTGGYRYFALAQYNADGSLDSSFGSDGMVTTEVGGNGSDRIAALGIQSDGKVVVVGSADGSDGSLTIARYNADGSLDSSFGSNGMVTTEVGSFEFSDLVIQADDKIVVSVGTGGSFLLKRYNANGSPDTSFDSDGTVVTHFLEPGNTSSYETAAYAVGIQPDGKIVAAGRTRNGTHIDFALARYNADGSLDTSFDSDGKLVGYVTSGDDRAYAVTVQPDGKIVVGGATDERSAVVRYNAEGSLDTSFGSNGCQVLQIWKAGYKFWAQAYLALDIYGYMCKLHIDDSNPPTGGREWIPWRRPTGP